MVNNNKLHWDISYNFESIILITYYKFESYYKFFKTPII